MLLEAVVTPRAFTIEFHDCGQNYQVQKAHWNRNCNTDRIHHVPQWTNVSETFLHPMRNHDR